LTVSPLFAAKKCYKELDINNVCVQLNIKARFIFFDRQNHNITAALMPSFLDIPKRLTLHLIEFIHFKV